jgi:FtsZ-binding cell division protein ZapB
MRSLINKLFGLFGLEIIDKGAGGHTCPVSLEEKNELERTVSALTSRINDLIEEKDTLVDEKNYLVQQKNALYSDNNFLKVENTELTEKITATEKRLNRIDGLNSALTSQNERLKQEVHRIQSAFEITKEENDGLQERVSDLIQDVDRLADINTDLEEASDTFQAEVEGITSDLEALKISTDEVILRGLELSAMRYYRSYTGYSNAALDFGIGFSFANSNAFNPFSTDGFSALYAMPITTWEELARDEESNSVLDAIDADVFNSRISDDQASQYNLINADTFKYTDVTVGASSYGYNYVYKDGKFNPELWGDVLRDNGSMKPFSVCIVAHFTDTDRLRAVQFGNSLLTYSGSNNMFTSDQGFLLSQKAVN